MKPCILIVDSNPGTNTRICDVLQTVGYDVVSVHDGQQALQVLNPDRHIVTFVEEYLDDINGIDLIKEFKSIAPDICAIVIADTLDPVAAFEGKAAGVNSWLFHPLQPADILQEVSTIIPPEKKTEAKPAREPRRAQGRIPSGLFPESQLSQKSR